MSTAWKGGGTRRWREQVRAPVLARDNYECQIKLPGEWTTRDGQKRRCLGKADCVHHVLGKDKTGDDPEYCVAACTPCNLKLGSPATSMDPEPLPFTGW